MEFVNVVLNIRELSKTTMATRSTVATSIAMASIVVLSQLPSINTLKRTVYRQRAANLKFPTNPRSLSEIHLTDSFSLTKKQEQCLQYDSGSQNSDRFLVFATNQQLDLVRKYTWKAYSKLSRNIFPNYTQSMVHCKEISLH